MSASELASEIRRLERAVADNNRTLSKLARESDAVGDHLRGLERQQGEFEERLARRSRLADRAEQLTNVRAAQVLARRTRGYTCTTLRGEVEGCFEEAVADARRAASDINRDVERLEDENRRLRARIRALRAQVAAEQA